MKWFVFLILSNLILLFLQFRSILIVDDRWIEEESPFDGFPSWQNTVDPNASFELQLNENERCRTSFFQNENFSPFDKLYIHDNFRPLYFFP